MGSGRLCRRSLSRPLLSCVQERARKATSPEAARLARRVPRQTESPERTSNLLSMATPHAEPGLLDRTSASSELGEQWRRLTRVATAMAFVTSPAVFVWLHSTQDWSIGWALIATFIAVAAFRGLVDLIMRRMIPWPSLYGTDDPGLREEDVVNRRR